MIQWLKNNVNRILLALAGLFACFMVGVILFADNGFLDYRRLQAKNEAVVQENIRMQQENMEMHRLVKRLKEDLDYIEHVARKELGMVGRNEQVYTLKKSGALHDK
ncbi:FtsB family cell division protein [Desulfosudis oleivorans]|uniref:Septum formation initiator n=1 Tax=Desulfosudis oleivorans (strain DSM 6200 / JCM 39069 / Hxd3) TaxID=96561 RepID=A8ZV40_DESOH|nr:septum formation initiator family protein [Desulfosudis oleivorans]ABW68130.1 Septum formation initiator [Desulfosudis oleivorans Hxd3]